MIVRNTTRSSEAGSVLRALLRQEGFHENISKIGIRSEILRTFRMSATVFTAGLQEAIRACHDDAQVGFFVNSLNISGDVKGRTLEERRRNSGYGGSSSTWVRHESEAAEILAKLVLQYQSDEEESALALAEGYNPLERKLAICNAEKFELERRVRELKAQLSQIHQLSSPL